VVSTDPEAHVIETVAKRLNDIFNPIELFDTHPKGLRTAVS
jgi:hypothetical protein